MDRFVKPQTDRVEISNGDWLELRRQATAGDTMDGYAITIGPDGARRPELLALAEVFTYLVDWSLTADGEKVSIEDPAEKLAALRALDPVSYLEIDQAVQAHLRKKVAPAAEKKSDLPGTASASSSSSAGTSEAGPSTT